jgi:hypothetical protein
MIRNDRRGEIMSHKEEDKIKINGVTGDKANEVLKDCYFYPSPTTHGEYDFFLEKEDEPLATGLRNGSAFTFPLVFSWVIPNPDDTTHRLRFTGSGATATATGSFLNNNAKKSHLRIKEGTIGDDVSGESGTFTAMAGSGGVVPEEEEAASAATA